MILTRGDTFRGHLPMAIPHQFVCAECGLRPTVRWLSLTEDEIVCGTNPQHDGLATEAEYRALHPDLTVYVRQDMRDFAMQDAEAQEVLRQGAERAKTILFGGDDDG